MNTTALSATHHDGLERQPRCKDSANQLNRHWEVGGPIQTPARCWVAEHGVTQRIPVNLA